MKDNITILNYIKIKTVKEFDKYRFIYIFWKLIYFV